MTIELTQSEDAFAVLERDTAANLNLLARDTEVSVDAGLIVHALDSFRRRHLLIPVRPDYPAFEDLSSRGVSIRTHELVDRGTSRRYLDVTCELPELRDLFAVVCDEMLAGVTDAPDRPGPVCISVLDRWRDLLAAPRASLMSREAAAGLLAELHLLERLAGRDPHRALELWTGPDRARHDFSGIRGAVEVKATTLRTSWIVEVNGLTQLEPPSEGSLHLHIERIEPVQSGGDSIPDVVTRLRNLAVNSGRLTRALSEYGYSIQDDEVFNKMRFNSLEERTYHVDENFPRLVRASVSPSSTLQHLARVTYVLDLTAEPPVPISDDDRSRLIGELLT